MSLRLAATFARRELRGGFRGFRIFLACLALGVAAIAAVGSVRKGIEEGLAREGAALLGGDAEMEFTYRFATQAELDWMQETATAVSETVDFRSMAVVGEGDTAERGLTQIKAVDDAYPLLGTVGLDPQIPSAAGTRRRRWPARRGDGARACRPPRARSWATASASGHRRFTSPPY